MALYVISQGVDPSRVYAIRGGYAAWQQAGLPVETGPEPGRPGD